jgi:hypothetical protein
VNISDHGENDPIEFELTPAEREAAVFTQAQLRFERNANDAKRNNDEVKA